MFDLSRLRIVKIEVIPAVAFGHPHDLVRFVKVAREFLVGVIDERLALFIDDCRCLAGCGIDGDDAQRLMAALVVQEGEPRRIGLPADFIDGPRIGKQFVIDRNQCPRFDVEQLRLRDRNSIAGFSVIV